MRNWKKRDLTVPPTITEANGEQLFMITNYSTNYAILLTSALEMVKKEQE